MPRFPIITAAFCFAGLPAIAGGLDAAPQPEPAPAPVVSGTDWSGAYVGLQVEMGDATIQPGPPDPNFDGNLFGVFGGYRYDFGSWVVGGEIDYVAGELSSTSPGSVDDILRAGIEVGYDAGPALIYGTVGAARFGLTTPAGETDETGVFYGFGVDAMVSDRVTLGIEILRHDVNDFGPPPPADLELTTVGLNLAIRF